MAANPSITEFPPGSPDSPDSPFSPPDSGTDEGDEYDIEGHNIYTKHGILMAVAWCILLPLGLLMIKIKKYPPIARSPTLRTIVFNLHIFFNVSAVAVSTAGFAYPFSQGEKDYKDIDLSHGMFGVAIMSLMWFQVLMPWIRPAPSPMTMLRRVWDFAHAGLGRVVMLLALVQVPIGIYLISDTEFGGDVQMFIYLCAIPVAVVFLTAQVFDRLRHQHDAVQRERDNLPVTSKMQPTLKAPPAAT